MLDDLKSMIEFASVQAEKIFRKVGAVHPMYHAITTTGETAILTPREADKDIAVAMVKAWFVINDVDRYVFIDEAWILDNRKNNLPPFDMDKIRREGLRHHPDRREIVMFSAENRRGEKLTAKRFILRPEIGKPKLSPLEIDEQFDYSEGRMVGLLRRNAEGN
jgi:hypothetical protein